MSGFVTRRRRRARVSRCFASLLDEGVAGDNVGVLLRGVKRDGIERGQVLAKPKSITPHTHFRGGGVRSCRRTRGVVTRRFSTAIVRSFTFRTTDVTGSVNLPSGIEMVMPGDNVQMTAKLISPIAMEEGLRFAVREGGRTVGAGVVSKIIE